MEEELRDKFAMAALAGDLGQAHVAVNGAWAYSAQSIALRAYTIADAMLQAREGAKKP